MRSSERNRRENHGTQNRCWENSTPAVESPTSGGVWLHANVRIKIKIVQCGDLLCSNIV